VTEQLALENALGEGLAVDGDEGVADAVAPIVEQAGGELFAGAAFPLDEDGGFARRDSAQHVEEVAHRLALGDDRLRSIATADVFAQVAILRTQAPQLDCAADDGAQLVVVEGLGDVIEGAVAHRRYRTIHGSVGGDQNDRRRVLESAHSV